MLMLAYGTTNGQDHRETRIGSFKEVPVFRFLKGNLLRYLALGLEIRAQNVGRWWMVDVRFREIRRRFFGIRRFLRRFVIRDLYVCKLLGKYHRVHLLHIFWPSQRENMVLEEPTEALARSIAA